MSKEIITSRSEIIDTQSQNIVNFLDEMGLPSEGIIAPIEERITIGKNLKDVLENIPSDLKRNARYLSKFTIGASVGIFDYSINSLWNEVIINLRNKVVIYGLDIFFDAAVGGSKARELYKDEESLSSIKDSVLLDTIKKLELISDITYKKLRHILDMRNNIGISHPNSNDINAFELLGWLTVCVKDVIEDKPTEAALKIKEFISNLKNHTSLIDDTKRTLILNSFSQISSEMCASVLRTLFGMYVEDSLDVTVRKNISSLAPEIWLQCNEDTKYKLGIVLEGYNVNLYKDKYTLGEQFFNLVKGQSYRSSSERTIIINDLITNLRDTHNGWDNFHHEPPLVLQIYSYVPNQSSILDAFAQQLFHTILMCRIGNGVQYNDGVSPGGKKYYDDIISFAGDKYAGYVIEALSKFDIKFRLATPICRKNAKDALIILRKNIINERILECIDYLISNIEKNPNCLSDKHFKDLSKNFIK